MRTHSVRLVISLSNAPHNTQSLLINTFMSLVTQQASEEVILDVLVGEAGLILPSLCREDLELVVLGVLDAAKMAPGPALPQSVVAFPSRAASTLQQR
jgi:hypothetical protein